MNVLIYLYVDTYLIKKPERQKMKDILKKLTKIAKRKNKVDEIVDYDSTVRTIKQMTSIDKKRLMYKAEEDQNQWTRNCQNSGDDKRRRPQQFINVDELIKAGYVWKETLDGKPFGHFERKVLADKDGNIHSTKKKSQHILRAVKLAVDESGDNYVYYTCGPEENGKHMYLGFLNKSKNPSGESMPCCFIKDQLYSKNKEKRNFYMKSIGILDQEENINKLTGDQLYILQDSNKIQEGRFSFLPKYLDVFFNFMLDNQREIRNHYLISTKPGYYFKYGSKQDEYKYLNALSSVLDISIDEIKTKLINKLNSDKNQTIFNSLNNGDIRTQFSTIDAYKSYIQYNEYLEYNLLNDLISIPGVIRKNGIGIIIFQKKIKIIKKTFEKEKVKENYFAVCQNNENIEDIKDPNRDIIFIIKEHKNYYPIIFIRKESEQSKIFTLDKTYNYSDEPKNIVNHIFNYYDINCRSEYNLLVKNKKLGIFTAKQIYKILLSLNKKEFLPKTQTIDARNKCVFIITNSGYIIPVSPSGSLYFININNNINNYINDYSTTFKYLNEINKITEGRLKTKPIGVYYSEKKGKNYVISAIMTENYDAVPIIDKNMTSEYIKKEKLTLVGKPNDDIIDKEILKGKNNIIIDNRVYAVSKNKYDTELYQLFRYHLSYYLNNTNSGIKYKEKLEKIINSNDPKQHKKIEVKKILYSMTSSELMNTYIELLKRKNIITGGSSQDTNIHNIVPTSNLPVDEKKWVTVYPETKEIDYSLFKIKNIRQLCYNNVNKSDCMSCQYCDWNKSKDICMLGIKRDLLIDFINKVAEEFIQNELKAQEIFKKDKYFVSDIVNYNVFTERPGEKIIMSSNTNINKILEEIFGKNNIPKIGKRKNKIELMQNYEQLNYDNPIRDIGNVYIQNIIDNNNTFYRAFANAYYWLLHPFNDNIIRNLGYYSHNQTILSNVYKSQVLDWIVNLDNADEIKSISSYTNFKQQYFISKSSDVNTFTNGLIELYILSKIYNLFVVINNENYDIIHIIHPEKDLFLKNLKKMMVLTF